MREGDIAGAAAEGQAESPMCVLLRESLLLWKADAYLTAGALPLLAVIHQAQAGPLSVWQAGHGEDPVRWWLCWHAEPEPTSGASEAHPRLPGAESGPGANGSAQQRPPVTGPRDAQTPAPPGDAFRRKPCASTLGLLRSLREALGVAGSGQVRIAAGIRNEGAA